MTTTIQTVDAACKAIGRRLEDIKVHDDREGFNHAPVDFRFQATWGDPDLDCTYGTGATPESAIWDLIDQTDARP